MYRESRKQGYMMMMKILNKLSTMSILIAIRFHIHESCNQNSNNKPIKGDTRIKGYKDL